MPVRDDEGSFGIRGKEVCACSDPGVRAWSEVGDGLAVFMVDPDGPRWWDVVLE